MIRQECSCQTKCATQKVELFCRILDVYLRLLPRLETCRQAGPRAVARRDWTDHTRAISEDTIRLRLQFNQPSLVTFHGLLRPGLQTQEHVGDLAGRCICMEVQVRM